jgi:hypothetical protein
MLMTCKALIHYIGTYKRITHKRRRSRVAKSENNARGSKQHQQSTSKHCEEADSNVRYTTRRTNIIRMGVGFSEGQSLLPFYADSGRKATFTILCQFQAGRFYRFIPRLKPNFLPPARCAPGKPPHTQQPMPITRPPAPHPRLAPLPTLASVASRATITRRSPPHRDRWRRPALRHPAQPRNSEISRAPAARMTFTILRELCRPYTFTILRQKSLTFTEPSPYGTT